ncbi:hypothetical protein GVN16_08750 [Emticicia sp. CRIBPO]|uniref:hypothetical protein n=1 Tax=Emticicia sp. CRIBPO TaxID=2683258 RepID=UPI001412FAFC|nr:hypothetical protein [Emticicia sp. CRIBPO]NBA85845.1 hypothetical protein [Emticicia sp. CRIBPO]
MKRRPRFFIVLGVAALTFGTLVATLGPARFNHHLGHHFRSGHCENTDHKQAEKPAKEQL